MGLDIRLPIGLMFFIIGILLALYGLLTESNIDLYARAGGTNVNLWWGAVMLVFGALMAVLGRRATTTGGQQGAHTAAESPEGNRTEAREHKLGLER